MIFVSPIQRFLSFGILTKYAQAAQKPGGNATASTAHWIQSTTQKFLEVFETT